VKILDNSSPVNEDTQWVLSQDQLTHVNEGVIETLFSLGNGTLGTRGTSGYNNDITRPECEGTYINGAYIREAIEYDETAYGFAQFNNKMMQTFNSKLIEISTNNEDFKPYNIADRHLNLRQASYHELLQLQTDSGKKIELQITRIVCQHQQNMMINHYKIKAINFSGTLQITSSIKASDSTNTNSDDPRIGNLAMNDKLHYLDSLSSLEYSYLLHQLTNPQSLMIAATSHQFEQKNKYVDINSNRSDMLTEQFEVDLEDNRVTFSKYSLYLCSQNLVNVPQEENSPLNANALIQQAREELRFAKQLGYQKNLQLHQKLMNTFWQDSDVIIEGNNQHQLAIRLNMLHLTMSAGKDGHRNIAAKGLTGPGYDGHYFWDSEIYIIPYFIYTQPMIAKSLLSYRFNGLAQAKNRAKEMGHEQGALFPWRTISGEECSSYFPAGTAQYHINAAIAFAVRQYFKATKDSQFIWDQGAELVIETARLWPSLGHFNKNKNNLFCIDTVTGPDEYTALVNNNYYTNAMVRIHLSFAIELLNELKSNNESQYNLLSHKLNISNTEIDVWQQIVDQMYLPHQAEQNISPQDDSFLDKKPWDFIGTPKDKYPLLLNFHPLVIYRHQVLKQADVILANFLQDDEVDISLKRNNLAFYEPITTHDSTLSACTHSLAYSETGNYQAAFEYFDNTVLTDLNNLHNNSHYGIHTAAMSGSWMCITQGFSGFRIRDNYASFQPNLPKQWQRLRFKLKLLGCQIQITLTSNNVVYQLLSGQQLALKHYQQMHLLTEQEPTLDIIVGDNKLLVKEKIAGVK
jgi:alpha,alpha-trehalose phosphorylase